MIPQKFASESQLSLYDAVKAYITPRGARCPSCKEIGTLRVLPGCSVRTTDSLIRKRICLHCEYVFETEMKMSHSCEHCGTIGKFRVPKTKNQLSTIVRIYECLICSHQVSTYETLPVPEQMKADRRRALDPYQFS